MIYLAWLFEDDKLWVTWLINHCLGHIRLTLLLTLMETGPLCSRWKTPSWSKAALHSGLKWILRAEVSIMFEIYQNSWQPRSQGLSSSRALEREERDLGLGWSRVFQTLADYKLEVWGGADKWEFLSTIKRSLSAIKTNYTWTASNRNMSTGNIRQTPKKSVNLPLR